MQNLVQRNRRWPRRLIVAAALWLALPAAALARELPSPPRQPKTGPGGADYTHAKVSQHLIGHGDTEIRMFLPAEPAPKSAPVVVFLHGWGAMSPAGYQAWINHLVRRGHIVLYPRYQATWTTLPTRMTGSAIRSTKSALEWLRTRGAVKPKADRAVYVGHSLGGVIAANMAALARREALPAPGAVFSVEPGDTKHSHFTKRLKINLPTVMVDYGLIPKGTLFLLLVGDSDRIVGDATALQIWARVQHLPRADRDFVEVKSDDRGEPRLRADHYFPAAVDAALGLGGRQGLDSLDWYGTWKLLDGLTDAVFRGTNKKYALGDTPEQRFMGRWSDGTPVREITVRKE
jgi:pimeloyl-ACP methyl ester carboxylesterase